MENTKRSDRWAARAVPANSQLQTTAERKVIDFSLNLIIWKTELRFGAAIPSVAYLEESDGCLYFWGRWSLPAIRKRVIEFKLFLTHGCIPQKGGSKMKREKRFWKAAICLLLLMLPFRWITVQISLLQWEPLRLPSKNPAAVKRAIMHSILFKTKSWQYILKTLAQTK